MEKGQVQETLSKVAEVELVYRSKVKPSDRLSVVTSSDAAKLFRLLWDDGKIELAEQFNVLYLNRSNKVLGIFRESTGGLTGTVADTRHILAMALKLNAVSMVLAHNHPSGSLKPSRADEELTQKIKVAATYFDLKVLDHLIITTDGYFSFADEGLL